MKTMKHDRKHWDQSSNNKLCVVCAMMIHRYMQVQKPECRFLGGNFIRHTLMITSFHAMADRIYFRKMDEQTFSILDLQSLLHLKTKLHFLKTTFRKTLIVFPSLYFCILKCVLYSQFSTLNLLPNSTSARLILN